MSLGYQGVQGIHAGIKFIFEHPEHANLWYNNSNYLGFLSVENEEELIKLAERAQMLNIKFSAFREPDIGNEITAIAIAPGQKSKKLCSRLKLALEEENGKSGK